PVSPRRRELWYRRRALVGDADGLGNPRPPLVLPEGKPPEERDSHRNSLEGDTASEELRVWEGPRRPGGEGCKENRLRRQRGPGPRTQEGWAVRFQPKCLRLRQTRVEAVKRNRLKSILAFSPRLARG